MCVLLTYPSFHPSDTSVVLSVPNTSPQCCGYGRHCMLLCFVSLVITSSTPRPLVLRSRSSLFFFCSCPLSSSLFFDSRAFFYFHVNVGGREAGVLDLWMGEDLSIDTHSVYIHAIFYLPSLFLSFVVRRSAGRDGLGWVGN